nr:hypothetical protein [Tanacetum cinerariifolium]
KGGKPAISPPRKRSRYHVTSVPISSPIPRALSYVCADVLPPCKRIRSSDTVTDLVVSSDESFKSYVPRETSSRLDVDVRGSDEPYSEPDIDLKEVKTSARGMIEVIDDRVTHRVVSNDILKRAQEEGAGHKIVATGQQSIVMSGRISKLERNNMRLRGMLDLAKALEARNAARNLEPLAEGGDEQEDENGDDYEGGNGGGNGNENGNGNKRVNGNKNRGENCNGNVKYAMCTLLNSALTWWNSHKRIIGVDAAYVMKWTELMKLTTEVYCPRNKIQKTETELMVPDEEDKVERFIGGLPDNIQGNVIAAEPTRLQDAICIANNLIDQKLKGYVIRAKNNRRAYTTENNEKKGYVESLPYYNKCKLHHEGPCTMRCGNCKRVGQMAIDYTTAIAPNTQRALVGNQVLFVMSVKGRDINVL